MAWSPGPARATTPIVGINPFGQKMELHGFDFPARKNEDARGSSMGSKPFPAVDIGRGFSSSFYMARQACNLPEDWISAKLENVKLKLPVDNEGFLPPMKARPARDCTASIIVFDA